MWVYTWVREICGCCMVDAKLPANWGPGTAWSLLQPANGFTQPPPLLFLPLTALPLSLSLALFTKHSFSMNYCSLHLPNPLTQVLLTLHHYAHFHTHVCTQTETHRNCGSNHNSMQPTPTLQQSSVQVPLACPDPHLDIALSMLTAKPWRRYCFS